MGDQDMEEEEDDLYGTSAPERAYNGASGQAAQSNGDTAKGADGDDDEDLEEGEEEESDSESVCRKLGFFKLHCRNTNSPPRTLRL
jgi:hypothetical protein